MNRLLTLAVAACCLSLSGVAAAQECSALLNTTITPMTFDKAVSSLSKTGAGLVKDEFETTAQFAARQAAEGGAPSTMFVTLPIDPKYLTYNADTGSFEIQSYSVVNIGVDWFSVFYGSPYYKKIETGPFSNVAIVLSKTDKPYGTYTGKNSYGASWQITQVNRMVDVIFDKNIPEYDKNFWGGNILHPPIWNLPVPVDQAREFKSKLRAAALIAPKAPFFFKNKQPLTDKITMQNPYDVTLMSRVIVADIQCVVFTDNANNVLLAAKTL